jgi:BON domain
MADDRDRDDRSGDRRPRDRSRQDDRARRLEEARRARPWRGGEEDRQTGFFGKEGHPQDLGPYRGPGYRGDAPGPHVWRSPDEYDDYSSDPRYPGPDHRSARHPGHASRSGGTPRRRRGYADSPEEYGKGDSGHGGKGPRGYRRSDARIEEDVNDRLTDDPWVDASDVTVTVAEGEVTLDGTVDSRQAKRRAEDCADAIAGVKHVQNNLRVRQPGGAGAPGS